MNRTIELERVYQLAPYQSIRLGDQLKDLPAKFSLNTELIRKLYFLMAINVEISYNEIMNFYKELKEMPENHISRFLEEKKINTMDEIKALILEQGE